MATRKDNLTAEREVVQPEKETMVQVFLPLLEQDDTSLTVDQSETVIINGNVTRIKRGEYVDVKIPVFIQLRNRYPNI